MKSSLKRGPVAVTKHVSVPDEFLLEEPDTESEAPSLAGSLSSSSSILTRSRPPSSTATTPRSKRDRSQSLGRSPERLRRRATGRRAVKDCPWTIGLGTVSLIRQNLNSLEGLPNIPEMESLYLHHNYLTSLYGLGRQIGLRTLHVGDNRLADLRGLPPMPKLESVFFEGNPVAATPHYRTMVLLAVGTSLRRIDNIPVTHNERNVARSLPAAAAKAVRLGWTLDLNPRTEQEWASLLEAMSEQPKEPSQTDDDSSPQQSSHPQTPSHLQTTTTSSATSSPSTPVSFTSSTHPPTPTGASDPAGTTHALTVRVAALEDALARSRRSNAVLERRLRDALDKAAASDPAHAAASKAALEKQKAHVAKLEATVASLRKEANAAKAAAARAIKKQKEASEDGGQSGSVLRLKADLAKANEEVIRLRRKSGSGAGSVAVVAELKAEKEARARTEEALAAAHAQLAELGVTPAQPPSPAPGGTNRETPTPPPGTFPPIPSAVMEDMDGDASASSAASTPRGRRKFLWNRKQ